MKKHNIVRAYNFSDAHLILKGKEKISFMRRDQSAFAVFGITETVMSELESALTIFSGNTTDIEVRINQTIATQTKNTKAEELRMAIGNVMKCIELAFGANTARYRQFGTKALVRKPDSELLIAAKVLVKAGKMYLQRGAEIGITIAYLDTILVLCRDFELLLHEQNDKIWERSFLQENRVVQGNAIYTLLIKYTDLGVAIWENTNVAKCNDYIVYDRALKN